MRSPVIDRHTGVRARLVRAKGPEAALIAHADSLPGWNRLRPTQRSLRHTGRHRAAECDRPNPVVLPEPKATVARVLGSADSG